MPSHDPEIYKDKIEVSLDGRQIFYLFFGGSVIVGLVFVLGVLVGRRVEARGHLDRADTQATSDPLAALDRLERSDSLSFRGALTGTPAPTDVEKAIGELERRRTAKPDKPQPATGDDARAAHPARPEDRPIAAAARTEPVTRPEADRPRPDKHEAGRDGDKHEADKHDTDKRDGDKRDGDKRDADKRDADKRDGDRKQRKHEEGKAEPRAEAASARTEARSGEARSGEARPGEGKVRFTLQLSSFQDKAEAEAFLGAIKAAGFQPYLTEAEVSGKGTFYRVRLGSYRSLEAANDARSEYEKTAKKSAQVMRL
ncbi:MAG TPA: SPOR domain-containing protein [Kofleriaceae bacterium]|jgi:cell division protein FtsN